MRLLLFLAVPVLLTSCAANAPSPLLKAPPKKATVITVVEQQDPVITVKGRRCKFVKPAQPKPLARPLPVENPQKLIDVLTDKLIEWDVYGDKVDDIFKCKP